MDHHVTLPLDTVATESAHWLAPRRAAKAAYMSRLPNDSMIRVQAKYPGNREIFVIYSSALVKFYSIISISMFN